MTNLNTDKLISILQDIGASQKNKSLRELMVLGVGALIAHRELCAKLLYEGDSLCSDVPPWSEVKDKRQWYDRTEDAVSDIFHDSQSTAE